jgi:plasmid stability protein
MKNVTIALDDETHRQARIRAAELGTSLSALVKDYLVRLVSTPAAEGVREMPTQFAHAPAAKADGPPWLVDG